MSGCYKHKIGLKLLYSLRNLVGAKTTIIPSWKKLRRRKVIAVVTQLVSVHNQHSRSRQWTQSSPPLLPARNGRVSRQRSSVPEHPMEYPSSSHLSVHIKLLRTFGRVFFNLYQLWELVLSWLYVTSWWTQAFAIMVSLSMGWSGRQADKRRLRIWFTKSWHRQGHSSLVTEGLQTSQPYSDV